MDNTIDWGVAAPIAVNSTSVYGYIQTLSVPKDSKHKDEAYEFLKWYWNKENTLKIAKAAYIMPGRNSAIQDESLNTPEYSWDICQQAVQKNVLPEYVKLPGWGPVSYTHLDVYKRQGFSPGKSAGCNFLPVG